MSTIEVFSKQNDRIGEGPLWSVAEQALYWIDIGRKRLHRRGLSDSLPQSWLLPDYPGCAAELVPARSLAIALAEGVYQLDLTSGATGLLRAGPSRKPGTRFNDGKVDSKGRLWIGTVQNNFGPTGEERPIDRCDGVLYRFDADGNVATLEDGIGISNTLAWSPDEKRFYFGDSLKGCIHAYDFDVDSGTICNKRTFFDQPGYGDPDGSAIDVDGCLWNARWGGSAVLKITPEGTIDRVIELPVPHPTSCIFGGRDLKTLFVTSATYGLTGTQLERSALSGSVLAIPGVGQGMPVRPMAYPPRDDIAIAAEGAWRNYQSPNGR